MNIYLPLAYITKLWLYSTFYR